MKQQLPPTRHDRHDAMLIVRLYDGDVSPRERDEANSLVTECAECARLLEDLVAITAATRALPAPPRPRDFILTEADAARLGRPDGTPVRARGRWGWSNVRRSFGGALAALGLVGVLLTGASTFLTASHAARLSAVDTSGSNSAPQAAQPKPATGLAGQTAAPAQLGPAVDAGQTPNSQAAVSSQSPSRSIAASNATPPAVPAASSLELASAAPVTVSASPADQQQGGPKSVATPPAPSSAPVADGGQVVTAPSNGYAYDNGSGTSGGSTAVTTTRGSGGLDPGTLAFAGFGLVLVLGLGLLAGPRILGLARRTP